jgi:hypothetical protein
MFHFRIGGGDMMMHWRCVSLIFLVSSTLLHAKKIVRMGTQSFLASCVFYCGQHLICSNGAETHHRVIVVLAATATLAKDFVASFTGGLEANLRRFARTSVTL